MFQLKSNKCAYSWTIHSARHRESVETHGINILFLIVALEQDKDFDAIQQHSIDQASTRLFSEFPILFGGSLPTSKHSLGIRLQPWDESKVWQLGLNRKFFNDIKKCEMSKNLDLVDGVNKTLEVSARTHDEGNFFHMLNSRRAQKPQNWRDFLEKQLLTPITSDRSNSRHFDQFIVTKTHLGKEKT